jgi:hypothetical protein
VDGCIDGSEKQSNLTAIGAVSAEAPYKNSYCPTISVSIGLTLSPSGVHRLN